MKKKENLKTKFVFLYIYIKVNDFCKKDRNDASSSVYMPTVSSHDMSVQAVTKTVNAQPHSLTNTV